MVLMKLKAGSLSKPLGLKKPPLAEVFLGLENEVLCAEPTSNGNSCVAPLDMQDREPAFGRADKRGSRRSMTSCSSSGWTYRLDAGF